MVKVRVRFGVRFRSSRISATATVSVSLIIKPSPPAETRIEVAQPSRHIPEPVKHAALQERLLVVLPGRIGPEQWVAGTGEQYVPGALKIAEAIGLQEGHR